MPQRSALCSAAFLLIVTAIATPPSLAADAPAPRTVQGTVVDADTGKPLPAFTVTWASKGGHKNGHTFLPRVAHAQAKPFTAGAFDFAIPEDRPAPFLWIEADGCLPGQSDPIPEGTTLLTGLTIKLRRAQAIEGKLLSPTGEPVPNAAVALATSLEWPTVKDGLLPQDATRTNYPSTTTDANGRFFLPPREGTFKLIALADTGMAYATRDDFLKSSTLRFHPWGRFEGRLMEGTKPVTAALISIGRDFSYYDGEASILLDYSPVTTDADGRFSFPRVSEFSADLRHLVSAKSRYDFVAMYNSVQLKFAATTRITLGNVGRPLTGEIHIPLEGASHGYMLFDSTLSCIGPASAAPPNWQQWDDTQRSTWWNAHNKDVTTANENYPFLGNVYSITLDKDNRFHLPAVPPGLYKVRTRVFERDPAQSDQLGDEVARGESWCTVDADPSAWNDQPQEVGPFETAAISVVHIGDPAPPTPFEKLDHTKAALADFKGKIVLLDFWATWCGGCRAAMPTLADLYHRHQNNPRFAMLSLTIDEDPAVWRTYIAQEKLNWPQGLIGPREPGSAAERWGIHGVPMLYLIGPDGKILFSGTLADLPKALDAALSQ